MDAVWTLHAALSSIHTRSLKTFQYFHTRIRSAHWSNFSAWLTLLPTTCIVFTIQLTDNIIFIALNSHWNIEPVYSGSEKHTTNYQVSLACYNNTNTLFNRAVSPMHNLYSSGRLFRDFTGLEIILISQWIYPNEAFSFPFFNIIWACVEITLPQYSSVVKLKWHKCHLK